MSTISEPASLCFFRHTCCYCSVTQSWLTPCDPTDCRMPHFPVLHYLLELLKLMSIESVIPSNHLILCPFSSCPQSFPASGSFPVSQFFTSGGQSNWSFSFSISPSNEYSGLISLGLIGLNSLQSKGLSRIFSNTTVRKHQFFCAQPSLWSNSHIHTLLLEKT